MHASHDDYGGSFRQLRQLPILAQRYMEDWLAILSHMRHSRGIASRMYDTTWASEVSIKLGEAGHECRCRLRALPESSI